MLDSNSTLQTKKKDESIEEFKDNSQDDPLVAPEVSKTKLYKIFILNCPAWLGQNCLLYTINSSGKNINKVLSTPLMHKLFVTITILV